eukprot:scaffold116_cov334-Pavlova_lutheri.AAC.11
MHRGAPPCEKEEMESIVHILCQREIERVGCDTTPHRGKVLAWLLHLKIKLELSEDDVFRRLHEVLVHDWMASHQFLGWLRPVKGVLGFMPRSSARTRTFLCTKCPSKETKASPFVLAFHPPKHQGSRKKRTNG